MIRIQPNAQNEIIKNIMRTMALSVFVLNLCLEHLHNEAPLSIM